MRQPFPTQLLLLRYFLFPLIPALAARTFLPPYGPKPFPFFTC